MGRPRTIAKHPPTSHHRVHQNQHCASGITIAHPRAQWSRPAPFSREGNRGTEGGPGPGPASVPSQLAGLGALQGVTAKAFVRCWASLGLLICDPYKSPRSMRGQGGAQIRTDPCALLSQASPELSRRPPSPQPHLVLRTATGSGRSSLLARELGPRGAPAQWVHGWAQCSLGRTAGLSPENLLDAQLQGDSR